MLIVCRQPPFGATAIYVNIGLLFVCGVAAGFNHFCQFAATVHAFHLICISCAVYASDALHYRNAVKVFLRLLIVWWIRGKIIRTAIDVHMHVESLIMDTSYNFRL